MFDVRANGRQIGGRGLVWPSEDLAPDGFSITRNGYAATGTGYGVDLLDEVAVGW